MDGIIGDWEVSLFRGGAQVKKRSCVIDLPSYRKRFPLSLHRKWQKGRSASSAPPQPDDRKNGVSTMSIRGLKGLRVQGQGSMESNSGKETVKTGEAQPSFSLPPAGTPIIKLFFFTSHQRSKRTHTHTHTSRSFVKVVVSCSRETAASRPLCISSSLPPGSTGLLRK